MGIWGAPGGNRVSQDRVGAVVGQSDGARRALSAVYNQCMYPIMAGYGPGVPDFGHSSIVLMDRVAREEIARKLQRGDPRVGL